MDHFNKHSKKDDLVDCFTSFMVFKDNYQFNFNIIKIFI